MLRLNLCQRILDRPDWRWLVAVILALVVPGQAASLTASLDRDTVPVGEAAVLTLICEGGSPKNPPTLPNVPNLRMGFGGQSSSYSWNNGVSSATCTYTYQLAPTAPGDYTLPPVEVVLGNDRLRSQPIALKAIKPEAVTPDAADAEQQLLLLKLVVPRRQVYLGEVVPVELQLYLNSRVLGIQQNQISDPTGDGLTFGKHVQGQQRQARVGNTVFNIIPLYYTMTANKTGTLTIAPVDATFVVELPPTGQPRRDNFDPFGIFNRNEAKRITLSAQAEGLEVLPLPEGAPASFNGAVGTFSLNFSAAPTEVTAGDPITVKVKLTGRGALDTLTLPPQAAWSDFKSYPPSAKIQPTDQLGLSGTKEFELVVAPQRPEVKQLPPFEFSYFDPEKKTYATLRQPGVPLIVKAAATVATPTLAGTKNEPATPKHEIAPIKLALSSGQTFATVIQRGAFAFAGLSGLAFVGLFIRRKREETLANNPRLRRQRAVAASLASGLDDLRQFATGKNSEQFFATLFRLLQEQLGERLDVPATAITESVIDQRLRPRGVAEPVLERLHELFQACNLARYAQVRSSHELEAFIPRLETSLNEIREALK